MTKIKLIRSLIVLQEPYQGQPMYQQQQPMYQQEPPQQSACSYELKQFIECAQNQSDLKLCEGFSEVLKQCKFANGKCDVFVTQNKAKRYTRTVELCWGGGYHLARLVTQSLKYVQMTGKQSW